MNYRSTYLTDNYADHNNYYQQPNSSPSTNPLPPSPPPSPTPSPTPPPTHIPSSFSYPMTVDGQSRFKQHYHLSQSPFHFVTAEACDTRVWEKCLIPNLQVTPVTTEREGNVSQLFFGPRGSGKTTIRMQLLAGVDRSKHLLIECYKNGLFSGCLENFRANTTDSEVGWGSGGWGEHFKARWTKDEFVACVMSQAMKKLVIFVLDSKNAAAVNGLNADERVRLAFLACRYSNTHPLQLATFLDRLIGSEHSTIGSIAKYGTLGIAGTLATAAATYAVNNFVPERALRQSIATAGGVALLGLGMATLFSYSSTDELEEKRAKECLSLVIQHTPERLQVMRTFFERCPHLSTYENAQNLLADFPNPLKDMKKLTKRLGFSLGPLVVVDGLDEADLLDPAKYPGVLNHLVREICYFPVLNSVLMLLFLPDSVNNLGLNDPFITKRWRRDVFPPRELQWEPDLLLELAARRFAAYQIAPYEENVDVPTFDSLLSEVNLGTRVRHLSRLRTPRQILLCFASLISRLERESRVRAQDADLELAVQTSLSNAT